MKLKLMLLLLLVLPIISAQEASLNDLEISLNPSGVAHHKIQNLFTIKQDTDSILFSVDQNIENVQVYDNKDLDFTITDQGILINKEVKANIENTIFIEYDSKDLVTKSGKEFIFSFDFSFPSDKKTIKVILPEGFILSDMDSPVSPKPTKIETDGKTITLLWSTENQEESFIIIYKRGHTSKSESLTPVYFLSGLIIILFIVLVTILINKKRTKEFMEGTLSDDENRIVRSIRNNKSITQKKISQITGFSKSKMSKLARRLEEKGVLKKRPFYKTNKFSLSKRLK